MNYAAINRILRRWLDQHRSQIIAVLFGLLLLCIALLAGYLQGRDTFSWTDADFKALEIEHAQLVKAQFGCALPMSYLYLLTIGALYLFTQCSVSPINLILVFTGACTTIWIAQRYMYTSPEFIPVPLVLVFWLIARSDKPGCLILLTMAGATLIIYTQLAIDIHRRESPRVHEFHYDGQTHYLFIMNEVDADFDFGRDLISAYSCESSTCKLVYPCGSFHEQVCLEKETIRAAWAGE